MKEITPVQEATLLLAQEYFVTAGRAGDSILVVANDVSHIRDSLKSIGINNFRLSSYVNNEKKNVVIVGFNY